MMRGSMTDALTLHAALSSLDLLAHKPPMWWPAYGTFEVVVGAVLTQNAQWTRVEQSLRRLDEAGIGGPEALLALRDAELQEMIRPSGLFKAKSRTLQALCHGMRKDFGDFEAFRRDVSRDWLRARRGIGPESADAILCYACERPVMVVDAYTARLLQAFGYELETYDALQSWCTQGFPSAYDKQELPAVYARFHGMIVEYVKRYKRGKTVEVAPLMPCQ